MDPRATALHNIPLNTHRLARRAVALLAAALVLVAGLWLAGESRVVVQLGDYNSYQCQTGNGSGPVFRVLTLTSVDALVMAERLCKAPAFVQRFSAVSVTWQPRQFLTAQHIVDETYDYFWNRQHLVEGMVPEAGNYYRLWLHTPTYPLYWISREAPPVMASAYFAGKTMGFLDDSRSQTFFLQPFKALKEAGIELKEEQKRFYPDMDALFRGFSAGEVDVVTGIPQLVERFGVHHYHTLLLAEQVPSGSWFLRNRWVDSLGCELARLTAPDPLFSQLPVPAAGVHCPEAP